MTNITILDLLSRKKNSQKISMITCYDYASAKIASKSNIDIVFAGDSLGMTMLGHKNTIPCTTEIMALFTQAVAKGAPNKFILGDLPFLSLRKDLEPAMNAIEQLMRAGAHALKFEGFADDYLLPHIINSGIPIMGHIGLTPQFIHQFGGFRVQGKNDSSSEKILKEALALEKAGCFAIVLECIPPLLAKQITESISIPTIGIGAGPHTDGQVLIWQDFLGMDPDFSPKFVKTYFNGFEAISNALNAYDQDVKSSTFPEPQHCYK
ncbi:MAG: 3-methyl-2-oxobutanoate hydroxymethyltransferase [Verrucomicrobia bacterium]|nr:MAG: 3-methyl-2-oxobutanoate hydroxymethyltransferase [Verrucomicrobiota bacterium]